MQDQTLDINATGAASDPAQQSMVADSEFRLKNLGNSMGQDLSVRTGDISAADLSDSLCTKDRNIRDALQYMKML